MKKIVLVSTFCNNEEKQNVLKESMEKYAKNGYQLLNNNIPQQFLN